jgi:hypothetical protein
VTEITGSSPGDDEKGFAGMTMVEFEKPPSLVTLTKVRVQLAAQAVKLDSGFRRNDELKVRRRIVGSSP